MFKDMLFSDTLRGKDATGVYVVNKCGNVSWAKEATTAETFMVSTEAKSLFTSIFSNGAIVVGHNRSATIGNKTDDNNAHPFIEGNTILVHNGTIRNKMELNSTVEVDSHAICHAIEEKGIVEALPLLNGAFAIARYNIAEKIFTLVRNKERPLYLGESENFWAFASEPWLIYGMGWRNGFKFTSVNEILPEELNQFILRDNEIEYTKEQISFTKPKPISTKKTIFTNVKNRLIKSTLDKNSNWKQGDIINFKAESFELQQNGTHKITGHHFLFKDVQILSYSKYSYSRQELNLLKQSDELVSSILAISNVNGKSVLVVGDCDPSVAELSRNLTTINEEMLCNIDKCSQCTASIKSHEIENCFVKIKGDGRMNVFCTKCVTSNVDKNPVWGNLHELDISNMVVN
jgi:asparagine synthetase B (glutamine-hydrolysing)